MTYRDLEHMTDAFIEVTGKTLEEAFETAGIAVVDTIIEIKTVKKKTEKKIKIKSPDLNNLLYSWLEEIIILTITDGYAVASFDVRITHSKQYVLSATVRGEKLDFKKHHFKLEVKAPTFHLMEIRQEKPVMMRFILDL